jgi:hypothetical protein
MRKNPDPEYYNKEVKQLTVKVRKVYSKRKIRTVISSGTEHTKELLAAKNCTGNIFAVSTTK